MAAQVSTGKKTGVGLVIAGLLAMLLNGGVTTVGPTPTTTSVVPRTTSSTTSSTTTSTTTSTSTTTTTLPEGQYPPQFTNEGRYFSDNASWNQPVSTFGYAAEGSQLENFGYIFWRCGGWTAEVTDPDCLAGTTEAYAAANPSKVPTALKLSFDEYSVPIYKYSNRTIYTGTAALGTSANPCGGGARVYHLNSYQISQRLSGNGSLTYGSCVPWNKDWRPGTGNDNLMITVDAATGSAWRYHAVPPRSQFNNDNNTIAAHVFLNCTVLGGGPNVAAGMKAQTYPSRYAVTELCGGGFNKLPFAGEGNIWQAGDTAGDQPTSVERGMGINELALVTRAVEVDQGKIRHALQLTIPQTMFSDDQTCPDKGRSGPCPQHFCTNRTDPEAPGAGNTCAIYLPPATRVEWVNGTNKRLTGKNLVPATDWHRQRTVPSGLRIALKPDVDIEAWLDARGYTGAKRRTARIFAEAFRDYGAIVAETGGSGFNVETDGVRDTTPGGSRDIWAANGITGDADKGLMTGLLTIDNIVVVNPSPKDPKILSGS